MDKDLDLQKECTLCGEIKPLSSFNPNKRYKDGFYKHCRSCHYEVYGRHRHIEATYGLTKEDYDFLLQTQKYECMGCGERHVDKPKQRLFVDHCHTSGKVRGLLCNNCNSALGLAKDKVEILKNLIKYLEKHNES